MVLLVIMYINIGCPNRYQTRHFFNNRLAGWLADRCSVSQQLRALQTHTTDTFLFIFHTTRNAGFGSEWVTLYKVCECLGSHNTFRMNKDLYFYVRAWWWLNSEWIHVGQIVHTYKIKGCLTDKNHIIEFCKHSGMVNPKFKKSCSGFERLSPRETAIYHLTRLMNVEYFGDVFNRNTEVFGENAVPIQPRPP
jgi:hypothetical protein